MYKIISITLWGCKEKSFKTKEILPRTLPNSNTFMYSVFKPMLAKQLEYSKDIPQLYKPQFTVLSK